MITASLLVISRSQSLALRLQEAVGEGRAHWLPSTAAALAAEMSPAAVIVELPGSGGERTAARLRRRFDAPLVVLLRPGQMPPEGAYACLPRSSPLASVAQAVKEAIHRSAPGILHAGDLSLDTQTRRLQVGDRLHLLRPIACHILAQLMESPGRTLARDDLFHRVWDTDDGDSTRALDVHISRLRQVIEADPRRPRVIVTERGLGYRLETGEAADPRAG
jgi:DNA-binding response OmpR family regulator